MNKRLFCLIIVTALLFGGGSVYAQETKRGTVVYSQDFQEMGNFNASQIQANDSLFSSVEEKAEAGAAAQVIDKAIIDYPPASEEEPEGEKPVFTDDLGDFSFFKSDYITHRYVGYPNTTLYPKSNEIECEKFDYKNPEKGDRIILKKTTDEDCYIDVSAKIFSTYRSTKVYKNFKIAGEFMCNFE